MGTPHVCFADELQHLDQEEHNGNSSNNNNNIHATRSCTKKWLLELEPTTSVGGGHSPSSSLSISPTPRYERNMGFFQQLSRRFGRRSTDDLVHAVGQGNTTAAAAATAAAQEEDANSSSTDSYSSSMAAGRGLAAAARLDLMSCASSETSSTIDIEEQQLEQERQVQHGKRKSLSRTSFSRLHRRSTSSLRRAFESLSLTSRSLSCSGPSPPPAAMAPLQQAPLNQASLPLKSALKSASTVELHQRHHHQHRLASKSASSSSACSTSTCSSATSTTTTATATTTKKDKSKPPPQRILRQPVSYTYLKGISGLPTQRVPRSSVCCQYARR
ncbi:hypothetical protein ACLKA6_005015 [Drosophila palustris]